MVREEAWHQHVEHSIKRGLFFLASWHWEGIGRTRKETKVLVAYRDQRTPHSAH